MRREWFLSVLILLFLVLSIIDPSLPIRSPRLIDYKSLAAIVSLLIVSRGLELSGIFSRIARGIVEFSGDSEFKLLSVLSIVVFLSSAVIMNDTAMFVFIPVVLTISKITRIDLPKAVTSIALAANIGSALTPIGNPQNIIIWKTYEISIWKFVHSMSTYVLLWLMLLIFAIWIGSKGKVETFPMPRMRIDKILAFISAILLVVNIVLIEKSQSFIGVAVTIFTFAIISRDVLMSFDVALIAIFALIFVDFRELSYLLSSNIKLEMSIIKMIILSASLSQIISNVPTTVMLSKNLPWLPLSVGVNLGGTGTVIGSLANFIAVRISGINLEDFHKYSLPYFLTALIVTVIVVVLIN